MISQDARGLADLPSADVLRESVRARYATAATRSAAGEYEQARALEAEETGTCCGPAGCASGPVHVAFGGQLYDAEETTGVPTSAVAASLGCGVPTAVADLRPGEVVLDLGSGAGADVLISARRVAPGGRVYGLDMTSEMLELARRNATAAGVENVEFLQGYLADVPLPDGSVDVVISNCVINLAADLEQWTGCVAGALTRAEFERTLDDAGLTDIQIVETHRVHEHAAAAIIRAHKR